MRCLRFLTRLHTNTFVDLPRASHASGKAAVDIAVTLDLGKAVVEVLFDGDLRRAGDRHVAQDHPFSQLLAARSARMEFLRPPSTKSAPR